MAPSANLEGKPAAKTIKEAQKYFGDKVDPVRSRVPRGARSTASRLAFDESKRVVRAASNGVDFYVDGGKIISKPSILIQIEKGKISTLRKGATMFGKIR